MGKSVSCGKKIVFVFVDKTPDQPNKVHYYVEFLTRYSHVYNRTWYLDIVSNNIDIRKWYEDMTFCLTKVSCMNLHIETHVYVNLETLSKGPSWGTFFNFTTKV